MGAGCCCHQRHWPDAPHISEPAAARTCACAARNTKPASITPTTRSTLTLFPHMPRPAASHLGLRPTISTKTRPRSSAPATEASSHKRPCFKNWSSSTASPAATGRVGEGNRGGFHAREEDVERAGVTGDATERADLAPVHGPMRIQHPCVAQHPHTRVTHQVAYTYMENV